MREITRQAKGRAIAVIRVRGSYPRQLPPALMPVDPRGRWGPEPIISCPNIFSTRETFTEKSRGWGQESCVGERAEEKPEGTG